MSHCNQLAVCDREGSPTMVNKRTFLVKPAVEICAIVPRDIFETAV